MKEKRYVLHICKNTKCNNGWIDEDLTNAKSRPPSWKYCGDCCKKYGFINPARPLKKKLSEKQKEALTKNQFPMRKKSPELKENAMGYVSISKN